MRQEHISDGTRWRQCLPVMAILCEMKAARHRALSDDCICSVDNQQSCGESERPESCEELCFESPDLSFVMCDILANEVDAPKQGCQWVKSVFAQESPCNQSALSHSGFEQHHTGFSAAILYLKSHL